MKNSNIEQKYEYDYGMKRLVTYYDFRNKEQSVRLIGNQMLIRTQQMFEYKGLPDTIPQIYLEKYLQRNGHCCIAEHEGNLYAFIGGLSGYPDAYYMPTEYIVANPYLKISKTYKIGVDCVFFRNDSEIQGLIPICSKYASLMVENDITMRNSLITKRVPYVAVVHSDNEKAGFDRFVHRIESGELSEAIIDSPMTDFHTEEYFSDSNRITDFIESAQYIKGAWFNELGIKAHFNMKREAISERESEINDEALMPLCENMLMMRKEAVENVNKLFGTNISVDFSSVWYDNEVIDDIKIEELENQDSEEQRNEDEVQGNNNE